MFKCNVLFFSCFFPVIERLLFCRREGRSQKDKHLNSGPDRITDTSLLARARACQHMVAEITVLMERKLQLVGYCYQSEGSDKLP